MKDFLRFTIYQGDPCEVILSQVRQTPMEDIIMKAVESEIMSHPMNSRFGLACMEVQCYIKALQKLDVSSRRYDSYGEESVVAAV